MNSEIPPEENLPPGERVWAEGMEVPDGITSAEERQAIFDAVCEIVHDVPVIRRGGDGPQNARAYWLQKATFTGEAIGQSGIIDGTITYEQELDESSELIGLYLLAPLSPSSSPRTGWLKNRQFQEHCFTIEKKLVNGEVDYYLAYDDFVSVNYHDNDMNEYLLEVLLTFIASLKEHPEALRPETG